MPSAACTPGITPARALLRRLSVRAAHAHKSTWNSPVAAGNLPAPVARYLELALGSHLAAPRLVVLEQTGVLRTDTRSSRWWPFQATHTASPRSPAFLWNAKVSMAPGLHLHVMDSLVDDIGAGEALLLSAVRMGHEHGRLEMKPARCTATWPKRPGIRGRCCPANG
ncbi:DUF6544 family protein [Azohydromonas lata]|uniref:DUF6544 family protein n=1 Tax=Azohydromonas lata TaxID=45677 RepID=A0ABU5I996_9BURK|nr:DUF6544 family protein [Azohydromonas lata]MDZ5455672.1 DUF6544 family protein [Azohydromonas lata]